VSPSNVLAGRGRLWLGDECRGWWYMWSECCLSGRGEGLWGISQAMASAAGEVTLVDVDSGEQGGIVLDGYPGGTLRWSRDGTELECVGLAGESVVWDVQVKAQLLDPSLHNTSHSLSLSLSLSLPQGRTGIRNMRR
jgi:hypothetical protein